MKNKNNKGFTLVELLVVMAILAVVAIILVPNVSSYVYKSKKAQAYTQANAWCSAYQVYAAHLLIGNEGSLPATPQGSGKQDLPAIGDVFLEGAHVNFDYVTLDVDEVKGHCQVRMNP